MFEDNIELNYHQICRYVIDNLSNIVRGQPLDLSKVKAEDAPALEACIGHCVINGPVGVGKENAFPDLFEGSIRSKFNCRSSQWRETCRKVAQELHENKDVMDVSMHVRMYGDLWPLAEKEN